ncbi:MAG: HAD family phosphatase [Candidatus Omnitrophica bacterium]|nr:HAD family phosphatase [Candidatus Omnitrophota bacterium]
MPIKAGGFLENWDIDCGQTIGLIFDVDELLIDNSKEIFDAYCALLACRNIPLDPHETFPGKDLFEIINAIRAKYGINDSCEALVLERRSKYIELLEVKHGIVNHGVKEVFEFLDRNRDRLNIRAAYASSSERSFIDIILKGIFRDCGLAAYAETPDNFFVFNGWPSASTCWEQGMDKKPSPMIYFKTLEKIGLSSRQCIAFEDSRSGVEAALNAGLYVFAVPSKSNREYFDKLRSNGSFDPRLQIVSSLEDILPFLEYLPSAAGVTL